MSLKNPQADIAELSKALMQHEFTKTNKVYIDLETLFDFRFGALLSLLKSDKELEYVSSCFENYNKRTSLEVARFFPALGITEEQLAAIYRNPQKYLHLATISPMLSIFRHIPSLIETVTVKNSRCDKNNPGFEIVIGTSSVLLPEIMKKKLSDKIRGFDPRVSVTILNRPCTDLTDDEFMSIDLYMLEDVEKVLTNPKVMELIKAKGELFLGKHIYAFPLLKNKLPDRTPIESVFANTRAALLMLCNFDYLEFQTMR